METGAPSVQPIASSSKGKRPKHFLGKNDALSLAASIADLQEKKVRSKTDKNHKMQLEAAEAQQRPKIVSKNKSKLTETKAMLVARRAQAKRAKARSRKQHSWTDDQEDARDGKPVNTARKKVSFS
ncbi:hypothetical protein BYT27DRAFT_7195824 [Phlegmacium glaucopus]|nr:hypothetical protein BYT27DRAFT_7195824 [Phlegmacium glaucopus]